MDYANYFIENLSNRCWILGDSAFAKFVKVRRVRKANKNLLSNEFEAYKQLKLKRMCSMRKLSSEWGIKDIKNSW
jgi:hypothetical protein